MSDAPAFLVGICSKQAIWYHCSQLPYESQGIFLENVSRAHVVDKSLASNDYSIFAAKAQLVDGAYASEYQWQGQTTSGCMRIQYHMYRSAPRSRECCF